MNASRLVLIATGGRTGTQFFGGELGHVGDFLRLLVNQQHDQVVVASGQGLV